MAFTFFQLSRSLSQPARLPARNEALDGIRGLAALSVAFGHCIISVVGFGVWNATVFDFPAMMPSDTGYRLLSIAFPSDMAVMVFFVLSGHVLWQSFARKVLAAQTLPDYILSRIWRLFPLLVPTTLLMNCFAHAPAADVLSNILLLRTNLLGVTWSLQVEAVASMGIAIMWLWGGNKTTRVVVSLLLTITIVPFLRGTLFVFLPAFALGALIGSVPTNVWQRRELFWSGLAVALSASVFLSHGGVTRCFEIVGAMIVVGCMGTRPLRILQTSPVRFLGAISYPLYLSHPIGLSLAQALTYGGYEVHGLTLMVLLAVVSLAITLPIAWLLHIAVEAPCMRWRPRFAAVPRTPRGVVSRGGD